MTYINAPPPANRRCPAPPSPLPELCLFLPLQKATPGTSSLVSFHSPVYCLLIAQAAMRSAASSDSTA
ncbi:hypothetical protein K523DRAFT_152338 [Schizophyllum commune Tattone D]|nr:hypothetical protein K523DRAFT_152338 [Schizophyllum commune Tattone D]